ncbi:hypothetical protein M9H77_13420 [Catharanthus roseus]|uniref:Uncharacterized protein n=1 Tax=Catharanthus roseus TaxID=4058 RepID=A0ACC0BKF0_CATRO|nr:hypothetical protein M9H77_13420 [Catharanthus roseus]
MSIGGREINFLRLTLPTLSTQKKGKLQLATNFISSHKKERKNEKPSQLLYSLHNQPPKKQEPDQSKENVAASKTQRNKMVKSSDGGDKNNLDKKLEELEITVPIVYGSVAFWLGNQANKVVDGPPFELSECGWGEFEIVITLQFHNDVCEEPLQLENVLVQMGNKKLIAENIADKDASLYEEFKKFIADKKKQEGSSNEDCLAGESQDPDMEDISEVDIDQMAKKIEIEARKEIFK